MIYLAADHRGYNLKEKIKVHLDELNLEYEDLGNTKLDSNDDYPDFAIKVAQRLAVNNQAKGILICGSGVGMDIVVNKMGGVRGGLGFSEEQIRAARMEDDINCLALPADFLDTDKAVEIVDLFLNTEFDNEENHRRRIEKIDKLIE